MKEITDGEVKRLIKNNYIKHNGKCYIDRNGTVVSYYRTRNKRYIEDKYADIAKRLSF